MRMRELKEKQKTKKKKKEASKLCEPSELSLAKKALMHPDKK